VKFGRDPAWINLVHTLAEPSLVILCGAILAVHLAGSRPRALRQLRTAIRQFNVTTSAGALTKPLIERGWEPARLPAAL
jgi:hypothetical protein